MRPIVLSEAAHLLGQIHEGMKALKGFVRIQFQEIPLNSLGGYFATSLSHPAEQRGEGMLPGCVSPAAAIPHRLLKCFRIVSITKSSTDLIVESLFKAAGFRGARLQRRKLLALFEIFSAVSATAAASSKHCGTGEHCGTAHGFPWTLSSLRHLISKAGVLLCSLQIGEQQESTAGERIDALEDRALVMALHRSVIPRLTGTGLTLMCSLMRTLWQPGSLPVPCGSPRDDGAVCEASLSLSSSEETSADPELCSVKVAQTTDEKEVIAKAIKLRQLSASEGFTSVVQQLTHLIPSYQTIAIVGQTGCGKSESLQTSLQVFRELGYRVDLRTIFTQALDSRQLLGHVNMKTGCMDGLLPELLRLHWCQHWSDLQSHIILKAFHLDGEIDAQQMECMQAILRNNGSFILPHSEQFKLPGSVKLFWELASLENVSPAVICCMGILNIPTDTESWKLCLSKWLLAHPTTHRHLLQQLTEEFLDPVVTWMRTNSSADKDLTASICATSICVENRVQTFCRIFEALGLWSVEIPPEDVKKCFLFSCVWAFGGTLESEHKAAFDLWWRERFRNSCVIPEEHQIWDYYIDTETCQFVRWSDNVPPQSFPCGQGISSQAFVHTIESEQLFYLTNLLSDAGHPVVLAGETGCGKSAVLNEYMQAHFSGDVVEVLKLKIHVNRSTSSRMLWGSLFDKLEWQYGTLYTPFRKKKLMCFVDDLNSAQVDGHGSQPACELMRQLLDCGGGFDPVSFEWRTVKNVAFLATVNTSCPSSPRLLRHFAVFRCSYPSCDDQYRIFSTLLNSYFLQSSPALKKENFTASADPVHRELLSAVTLVTVETQDRLRTMFLRISQRGHYIFTLRDLAKIFRNLCLSLNMNGSSKALLYLWRHECDWVYGHRLASYVDYARYKQEFNVAVKKVFADNEQVELITSPTQPLFSNVINLEGGLVTASPTQWQLRSGNQMKLSNQDMSGDGYRHNFDEDLVRKLLEESVQEHNKTNPRIAISFYRSTMELVCRLTRNLLSPHEVAHTLLCGEGCPGMAIPVTKLAAHLCGFSIVRIHSFSRDAQSIDSFKSQLVDCCVQAGIQGKKVLCLMNEERLDKATMVYFTHLVVPGSITHLFSSEQLSSIINEVRSEALTENISSTKEAVLEFFVQRVTQNLRCVLICPSTGCSFSQNCQEFPIFTNTVNIYFVPHWSRSRLVEHALYHVDRLKMLTAQERENICHLLASMHLAVGKSDGRGKGMGRFGHLTNSTYESFARTFVRLFDRRHAELVAEHRRIEETLGNIDGVLKASAGLRKASQQAEVILEEHKKGAKQILTQIGQDRAVAEQQVRTVREQMGRIEKLQRLLPEYQLAHARSVYKCTAMASDIKKLVGEIDIEALGELRAMQQPDVDTEDLMASIIAILKSPTADLTWSKGAKRQMANLERFLDELSTFDEIQLSETTLGVLEKYLQKPSFTAENMERKTGGNSAASSLLKWLQGAVSYHRVMMSKVRPLQSKVAEMSAALEESVQRLKSQQTRKANLLRRLEELEKGFEEASIDKNEQERKSAEISKKLAYLSTVEQVLQLERRKYSLISCCMAERLQGLAGSTAMAAGLLCYLGPYEHLFCQLLLSLEWPRCLRDRGLSFLIDSFDPVKGRVIDFSVEFFKREGEETEKETNVMADSKQGEQNCQGFAEKGGQDVQMLQEAEGPADAGSFSVDLSAPVIASEHYHDFVKALLKIVAGDEKIHHWVLKDWTLQQMQNAVILLCSWQRPPFLMHPSNEAEKWFQELQETSPPMSATSLRLGEGPDGSISLAIEKALHSGHSLFIYNYTQLWASLIRPLIEHCNTVTETEPQSDNCSSIVCLEGRRLLGSDQFKLYLATSQAQRPLPADITSGATLVNCSEDEDTIRDFLLHRLFAGTQQDLHRQLKNASKNVHQVQCLLKKLEQKFQESLNSSPQDIEAVTAIFNNRKQLSEKLERAKSLESRLFELRNKLLPIAQRGAQLFSVLQALRMLAREYKFPLSYFLRLFDKAVGNTFTENEEDEKEEIDIKAEDARKNAFNQANSVTDPEVTEADDSDDRQHGGDIPGREALERNLDEPVMDPHVSKESPSSQLGFPKDTADISRKHKPPSPAADSLSLSTNEIRQLVDQLTETVHQTINQSLYPEHSLVFSCMLSLYIQMEGEGALREEEVSFLLKGFQDYDGVPPSLRDLGSEGLPPAWMPAEQWECLLALSLLPGPLEGVCVQIAEHSTEWERWFNLDYPELERLPLEGEPVEMNGAPESPDTCSVSGMHKLLLLRALRPDRLISALPRYLLQHDSVCTWGGSGPQAADVKSLVEDSVGILVLLPAGLSPTNGLSNVCSVMSVQPTTVICSAAKEMGISVSVVSTREDCLSGVEKALGDMMECGGWLVVENVHLASMSLLKKIHHTMNLAAKQSNNQFRLWLTAEPGAPFPEDFLSEIHKVSWHALMTHCLMGSDLFHGLRGELLPMAVVLALEQVHEKVWKRVLDLPAECRGLCFGTGVLHGLIVGSQFIPGSGLSQVYPLNDTQLLQAMDAVISSYGEGGVISNSFIQVLIEKITEIYLNTVTVSEDALYIEALAQEVLLQCTQPHGKIAIGEFVVPIPAANIEPVQYSLWLCRHLSEFDSCPGLALHKSTQKLQNQSRVAGLLHNLSEVYEVLQCGLPSADHEDSIAPLGVSALSLSLDLVLEQLPGLLEVDNGPLPWSLVSSLAKAEDSAVVKTVGYALLEECLWMNRLLCHIRQQVTELFSCTLRVGCAFPPHLAGVSQALEKGRAPQPWIPPNYQPSVTSLQTWLEDLKKKHSQLKQWVEESGRTKAQGSVSNEVTSVWLGALVNPAALILALRHEYAIANMCLLDETAVCCNVSRSREPSDQYDIQPHCLTLEGLCLQGASWDFSNNALVESSEEFVHLPYVTVRPILHKAAVCEGDRADLFECPVYMTPARKSCLLKLPLRSTKPAQYWRLKKAAVILDCKTSPYVSPSARLQWAARRSQKRLSSLSPLPSLRNIPARIYKTSNPSRISSQLAEIGGIHSLSQEEHLETFEEYVSEELASHKPKTSENYTQHSSADPKTFLDGTDNESPDETSRVEAGSLGHRSLCEENGQAPSTPKGVEPVDVKASSRQLPDGNSATDTDSLTAEEPNLHLDSGC
ncbi:uncharacterized protein [Lepisosteus oculatus]|uniref:uncharacterized protein isoform X1 n=1 Tax=Lepisosteus oculatus TaxID=7918 RepID=UPI00371D4985